MLTAAVNKFAQDLNLQSAFCFANLSSLISQISLDPNLKHQADFIVSQDASC